MPFRRLGTAASAVATMAGDHGSRSSRPRLEKPKKTKNKLLGEIEGRTAKLTKGEMETEEAVRAEGRSTELGDLGATAAAFLGARQT